MQDNAITRIENLHRLKCLEYINLAMNAIEVTIEACITLARCKVCENDVVLTDTIT